VLETRVNGVSQEEINQRPPNANRALGSINVQVARFPGQSIPNHSHKPENPV
jgi:hypothetical protein